MRNSSNVKEVQQLTKHLVALSRALSYAGDKVFHFFATLKKMSSLNGLKNVSRHSQS